MKSGYDQFFNAARKGSKKSTAAPARNGSPPHFKKQRRRKFPLGAVLLMIVSLSTFAWTAFYPDEFDQIFQKVEIRFMGMASASDEGAAKSAEKKEEKSASSAKSEKAKGPSESSVREEGGEEDLSYLGKLNERRKELDLREKELGELEEELHRQRTEVEARIKKLEEIRAEIANVLKEKVDVDQSKVDKLVEFYSNMKPKQAAEILAAINEDLAVEILGKMKKKNAADIMNLLAPAKAQVISEKFAGYKRR